MRVDEGVRSCRIGLRGEQAVRVFTRRTRAHAFELWVAIESGGESALVDHIFTSDDLEARLAYSTPGDLVWKDESLAAIPGKRVDGGFIAGENVKTTPFHHDSIRDYLAIAMSVLPIERRPLAAARRAILGSWSDGKVILELEPSSRASSRGTPPDGHPFAPQPEGGFDWWNLSSWRLTLLNGRSRRGYRAAVFHVGDELHVGAGFDPTRGALVHVFSRTS